MAFLLAVRDLPLRAGHESEYRVGFEAVLSDTLEKFTTALGDDLAQQLRDWLTRNFVDHDERMRLWIWSVLLPRLAAAYGHGPRTPPPLNDARLQRFQDIVRSYFNPEISQADDEAAQRARLEPLSMLEHQVLAIGRSDRDHKEWDVVDSLTAAGGNERARDAWMEIDAAFTQPERAKLLAWAREEGASRRMPLHLIALRPET